MNNIFKALILNPIVFLIGFNSFAQNMQLADLYLTFNGKVTMIPLDVKTDIIATSWTLDSKFYPDHNDFNSYVENTKDAYLVWQEAQNHKYISHIRFSGDSIQQIEKLWVSEDEEIFIVLSSSGADTISVDGQVQKRMIIQPELGNTGLCYFLIKLSKFGKYQDHLFLGYNNFNRLTYHFPTHIDNKISCIMYSGDTIHHIPGTSQRLLGSKFAIRSAKLNIDCKTFDVSSEINDNYEYVFGNRYSSNNVEVNFIRTFNDQPVHDSSGCIIRYKGNLYALSDSLNASRNIQVLNAVCIVDTMYIVHSSTNEKHAINGIYFEPAQTYISKWVTGSIVDSMTSNLHSAKFFLSPENQVYLYGHIATPDYKPVSISFFKGEPYTFKDDQVFRFWGPIDHDSLKWITHIAGNIGNGTNDFFFYADSNTQYFKSTIKSWMDLDPGPYEWQFNPLTYDGKSVIAKYNCFPNSVFTFDQTGQKVQFYNYSSGGITYKWLFGVGTANSTDLNPIFKYPAIGDYDVTLIAFNECGSDTFTFPVSVDKMISTNDIQIPEIMIYPNPALNKIHIHHVFKHGDINIIDMTGNVVWRGKIHNALEFIDVSSLSKGMYVVRFKEGLSVATRKLFIY